MADRDFSQAIQPPNIDDGRWMKDAYCAGIDTELFFPEQGEQIEPLIVKMCEFCPVRKECIDYALKYNLEGIWGGMGKRSRERYRGRRKAR